VRARRRQGRFTLRPGRLARASAGTPPTDAGGEEDVLLALADHDGMKAMDVPSQVLTISKVEGATRRIEEAIKALERGDFDIAVTLAGAAESMFESTGEDLWAAMHNGAEDARIPRKDIWDELNNARTWLKHPGGSDRYEFDSYLAVEMILHAVSKIERASWTPPMNDFADWLAAHF
jgi:hypothetical protein